MRGCIVARKPYAAYNYYREFKATGMAPTPTILDLKGVALSRMIRNDTQLSFGRKLKIFRKLVKHNKTAYDGGETVNAASAELTAAISLYHKVDPMEAVRILEQQMT